MKTLMIALLTATLSASCASTGPSTAGAKPYPLTDCIVSDNELGSMGPVITRVHEGQVIKFCCKPCVKKFDKDPAKYMAKIPR